MIKNYIVLFLLFTSIITSGYVKPIVSGSFEINATKNAVLHNDIGLRYLEERCYYAAVQEFKIAISLNPNSQPAAVAYTETLLIVIRHSKKIKQKSKSTDNQVEIHLIK